MPQYKRIRLINPRPKRRKNSSKKSSRPPAARRRHKNPLGEELILLSNPRRKRKSNPGLRRNRRRNPLAAAPVRRRRRSNPHRAAMRRNRRHNPNLSGAKSFGISAVKAIVSGAVGALATRAIVQGVLGDKNVGMMGYLANLGVALGGGFAIFKFTKSAPIAIGFAVGGAANTVQRIWSEKVAMTSPAAAAPQLGDLDFSSNGLGGVGLSGYVNTPFALPSVTDGGGLVQSPYQASSLPASAAAASAAGGSTVALVPNAQVTRFQPRY